MVVVTVNIVGNIMKVHSARFFLVSASCFTCSFLRVFVYLLWFEQFNFYVCLRCVVFSFICVIYIEQHFFSSADKHALFYVFFLSKKVDIRMLPYIHMHIYIHIYICVIGTWTDMEHLHCHPQV